MDEMELIITGGYDSPYYRAYFIFRQYCMPPIFVPLQGPKRYYKHLLNFPDKDLDEVVPLIGDFETIHALAWAESMYVWPITLYVR